MAENLTDRAHRFLLAKLTSGKLLPGSRLSNRALADEMGTSMTPVRAALNRLISAGLLAYYPDLGVFVPKLSRHEVEEIYELREIIECAAVVKVCGKLSEAALREMQRHLDEAAGLLAELEQRGGKMDRPRQFEAWMRTDTALHDIYLRATGNRRLMDSVEDLRTRAHIVGRAFNQEPLGSARRTHDEHCRIFEAFRAGAVEEARQAMADHIQAGCRLALSAYDDHYMEESRPQAGPKKEPQARGQALRCS